MMFPQMKGFTIVELMIAMALSLLLGIGVFQVFSANHRTARMTQAMSNVQEVGRLTSELIARDLRNADYWGCAGQVSQVNIRLDQSSAEYDEDAYDFAGEGGLFGLDDVAADEKVDDVEVVAGTDIIEIRSLGSMGMSNSKSMPNTSAAMFLSNTDGIQENDILAISDCRAADVFQVTKVDKEDSPGVDKVNHGGGKPSAGPGNINQKLSQTYDVGAQVMQPVYRSYFISNNSDGVPRLMVRDQSGQVNELADWVEDLQFLYGLDSDSNGVVDIFANAGSIQSAGMSFDDVLSVRTTIRVASSETNVVEEGIEYDWNGNAALDDAVDLGRLRREFTVTASLRSRLP